MKNMSLKIIPLDASWTDAFIAFTDIGIGTGYYRKSDVNTLLAANQPYNTSFLLVDEESHIRGVRVSYPPGRWIHLVGPERLFLDRWSDAADKVGYFKSLFLDPAVQGQGWGPLLSAKSIEAMKQWNAKAILTHSWKESPNNSSTRYLESIGFKVLGEHKLFWSKVDYDCSGCNTRPCICTANEMYKRIE